MPFPAAGSETAVAAAALAEAREHTLGLVRHLGAADLQRTVSPLMSPLVWDLGHIAAFEDLWTSRTAGEPMLQPGLADVYDAAETPRAQRGTLEMLGVDAAYAYLGAVAARTRSLVEAGRTGDGFVVDLLVRHERQHGETMLQTFQLGHLPAPPAYATLPAAAADGGLDLVPHAGGPIEIGAGEDGFAYDNERPRHVAEVAPFAIGRTAVTNAAWERFVADGGYERRDWWSEEGWAWRREADARAPLHWCGDGREWWFDACRPLDPKAPVCHVSWFEADAFARAHDARLPTEFEWEAAATAGAGAPGAAPGPVVDGLLGGVWEWTRTEFDGYPGFRAYPYREYSEVFFGTGHRVLRGGSWATAPALRTSTFRNWDLPQRRQIFSGVRIARDA